MWDDEECSAEDVGGNLGGPCTCSQCAREHKELTERRMNVRETPTYVDRMFGPREMSYDDWSEFQRLKSADVAQGKRIAELIAEVEQLKRENERLRDEPDGCGVCDR